MREWQSQSHVRWYCRYHVVIVPKYRQKAIFGTLRKDIGKLLRELCTQMGIELIEGHAIYLRDPLCGAPTLPFTRTVKLVALAEAYGQIEFAFELLVWLSRRADVASGPSAARLNDIIREATRTFNTLTHVGLYRSSLAG